MSSLISSKLASLSAAENPASIKRRRIMTRVRGRHVQPQALKGGRDGHGTLFSGLIMAGANTVHREHLASNSSQHQLRLDLIRDFPESGIRISPDISPDIS